MHNLRCSPVGLGLLLPAGVAGCCVKDKGFEGAVVQAALRVVCAFCSPQRGKTRPRINSGCLLAVQAATQAEAERLPGQLQDAIVAAEVGRAKVLLFDELTAKAEKLVRLGLYMACPHRLLE